MFISFSLCVFSNNLPAYFVLRVFKNPLSDFQYIVINYIYHGYSYCHNFSQKVYHWICVLNYLYHSQKKTILNYSSYAIAYIWRDKGKHAFGVDVKPDVRGTYTEDGVRETLRK